MRLRLLQRILFGLAAGLLAAATGGLPPAGERPLQVKEGGVAETRGYVSSDACQACHTEQYASWRRTYHRTMTQVVTGETVLADFNGPVLRLGAQEYRLSRDADGFWVDMPDPARQHTTLAGHTVLDLELPADTPRVRRQIVQSTGSHHYQLYWYPSGNGRELYMLPFVWLKDEACWVPRMAVFLAPPDNVEERLIWNVNCLPCHSTDGQPHFTQPEQAGQAAQLDSRMAEAGIACEACHGPGQAHVASKGEGAAMVHPAKLPAARSAEVCGQCHSVNLPLRREDWVDYLLDGPKFRPGEELRRRRFVVSAATVRESPMARQLIASGQLSVDEYFWADGEVRVTGREYNGLVESPCYASGEFSCLSCHSMHEADPDDLLAAGMDGDQACTQCHPGIAAKLTEHTHHPAGSSGSRCYNCHMPHTSYGLLKAERSHTVTSPSVAANLATGRTNACNICHVDKPLGWTQTALAEWYGYEPMTLSVDQQDVPEVPRMLLQGDAGQRALAAYWLGWPAALDAAGDAVLAGVIAEGLTDEYATVRYIAGRSLLRHAAVEGLPYDFMAPAGQREAARQRATEAAGEGLLRGETVRRLRAQRDQTPVTLSE